MAKYYEAFKKLTAKRQNAKRLKENKEQRMLSGVGSGYGELGGGFRGILWGQDHGKFK